MPYKQRVPWSGYAMAVLSTLLVAVFRLLLARHGVGKDFPFLLFSLPTVLAAWSGGLGPGLLATLLSMFVVDYFFVKPYFEFSLHSASNVIGLAIFFVQGAIISWLGESGRRSSWLLSRSHLELEGRVGQRTTELSAANVRLHEDNLERRKVAEQLALLNEKLAISNRELEDFASVASHDLQEPLRKIQAFGDRLAAQCSAQLSEEGRDYLGRMQNAALRMQALINDLLGFARITTKAQPFGPCDLNVIAREVLSDLELRVEQSGGRVEVDELPVLDADATQMRQLLQNLLANALKFSNPDQPPRVRVYAKPAAADVASGRAVTSKSGRATIEPAAHEYFELCVSDNGIGFDEKYLDRIFNVFQRLHGRSSYEGTGIGLAVCRKIAQRHGGSITARSRPESGTTFIVSLPYHHAHQELP